jgi:hypothetical protein
MEVEMARAPRWEPAYCAFFEARQRSSMRAPYAMLGSWAAAEDAALVEDPALTFPDPVVTPPPPADPR